MPNITSAPPVPARRSVGQPRKRKDPAKLTLRLEKAQLDAIRQACVALGLNQNEWLAECMLLGLERNLIARSHNRDTRAKHAKTALANLFPPA